MSAIGQLSEHPSLAQRRTTSKALLVKIREAVAKEPALGLKDLTIFSAGSIARLEAGPASDLDVFVLASPTVPSGLVQLRFLARLADVNENLGFPQFADELRYMRVYDLPKIIRDTGNPTDDHENSFTTRILLLLESAWLSNEALYESAIDEVCRNYFRDNKGKKDFRPLFLINDLLRYWRTLCLNYEQCRSDPTKSWRKKNLNLRFSRLTTVFATISILMVERPSDADGLIPFVRLTPLERLAEAIDRIGDGSLNEGFGLFLDHYSGFLSLKDGSSAEAVLADESVKQGMRVSADFVASYFSEVLRHKSVAEYARYLLL